MKFKVTEVKPGMSGLAYITIRYEDGKEATIGVQAGESILFKAQAMYEKLLEEEKQMEKSLAYAKQFKGKEMSF